MLRLRTKTRTRGYGFLSRTLARELNIANAVVAREQEYLRHAQQVAQWQQARLDAWGDDGISPIDFERDYPRPVTLHLR